MKERALRMANEVKDLIALISAAAAIVSIVSLVVTLRRTGRKEVKEETADLGDMRNDLKYITRGVDDIRLEQRAQRDEMSRIAERVTRCEESGKQAHKRLDSLERERRDAP